MQRLTKPLLLFQSSDRALDLITEGFYRKDVIEVRLPTIRSLFPTNPADVKRVLIDESEHFPKSDVMGEALAPLIGDSIFVSNGACGAASAG